MAEKLSISQKAISNQNTACDSRSWQDCGLTRIHTCSLTGLGAAMPQQSWEANMEKTEQKGKDLNNTFRNNSICFVGFI